MALYKNHYIKLDTKRTPRIALQNIVAGETGNRLIITFTNDDTAVTLTAATHRVALRVDSALGTRRQDSAVADNGVTFSDGKAVILLSKDAFTGGMNRCCLEVYTTDTDTDDTLICSAEFQFVAKGESQGDNTGVAIPLLVQYEQQAEYFANLAEEAVQGGIVDPTVTEWLETKSDHIDGVIEDEVDDWLGDHPEATTTVQDGAITLAKLNSLLKVTQTITDTFTWTQGGINSAIGGNTVSSTRVRGIIGLITADTQKLEFAGYDAMLFKYTTDAYSTSVYEGSNGSWIDGGKADLSDYIGKYVRVCLRYHDDSAITPSDISGVKVTKTSFTDTSLSVAGKAADAKTVGEELAALNGVVGKIVTATFTKPSSGNAVVNFAYPITANKPVALIWSVSGTGKYNDQANIYTRETASGANVETLATALHHNTYLIVTPTTDAAYLRIVATASGTVYVCDADTLQGRVGELEQLTADHDKDIARVPLTRFEINHDLYDSSAIVTAMGLTTENRAQQMQKSYDFFHTLAQTYSDYVTEILDATTGIDGETSTGLSYPWYATDGVTVGTHTITVGESGDPTETIDYNFTTATSPYTVRLYKLCDTNPALPSTGKKKVFLIGGTHGNEVVAPIDLCILASRLCGAVDDPDILKLRSAFDFYIIPVLNGFGAQYLSRVNGNLVDLNRNFPTEGWTKTTINESTFSNLALCTFSGKSAGSEFETKLVMALFERIQPDVLIDHHNSGTGASQFYTIFSNSYVANLCYQALTDCAYTFIKRLPAYFGTNYNLFSASNVSPGTLTAANGHMDYWAYENGCLPSGTCEVFEAINFVNGVRNVSPDKYTIDTFKVSEYTLRSVLLHLCQYAMEH